MANRYYINMNDGRVILGTEETKDNICYREIDLSWAIAIRDGKVTPQKVVELVQAKVGMIPYSEMMKGIQKLNVRSRDLHMEDHVFGSDVDVNEEEKSSSVIGSFQSQDESKDAAVKAAAALKVDTKSKVNF